MNFSDPRKRIFPLIILLLTATIAAFAKTPVKPLMAADPPHWWTGMKNQELEIVFYGNNLQDYSVTLESVHTTVSGIALPPNRNYVFVKVNIGNEQQPGELIFLFKSKKKKEIRFKYLLKAREAAQPRGITSSDLMYLVFPDRFANGDTGNDALPMMNEKTSDRKAPKGRHGGDLQGIMDHLDYFRSLGVSALWINPVLENNQGHESYHGYAFTDVYKVDPRLGSNDLYKELSKECHAKGIKLVWDMVYNHWGSEHRMIRDLPDSNWIHRFPEFTRTSYRAEVLVDPYASDYDRERMSDAWFDRHMPDLNQEDPHLAQYLIQNSIWWIEEAGLDAFRVDTYAYPDQQFMKELNNAIAREYPDFFIFGETWVQGSPVQAWFTGGNAVNRNFDSGLQSVTDFQLYYAITKGLNENFGWEEGFRRIQLTLAQDALYWEPDNLVTFLDNHDLSRYYSVIKEDYNKFKMGVALLYTLRGIPCIYYGTEILMKNFADPDALVREDFPGGWQGDKENKFLAAERSEKENEAFNFIAALGKWRMENTWMSGSRLTQFVPENNTYVYFRHDDEHSLMCVYNGNEKDATIDLSRYTECLKGRTRAVEISTGLRALLKDSLTMSAKSVMIYGLKE